MRTLRGSQIDNLESRVTASFIRLRKRLSIKGTFHDLRATYITRLIESGVKPTDVQYLAGHSSIETTMDYFSLVEGKSTEAARGCIGVTGLEPATS